MGCLYNEVRRGLLLTMEAKGVRSGLNCVRSGDEAAELGDVSRGFVHQLGADTVEGGGEGGATAEFEEEQKRLFPVGCLLPAASNWNHQTPAEPTSDILSSIEILNIEEKQSRENSRSPACFLSAA